MVHRTGRWRVGYAIYLFTIPVKREGRQWLVAEVTPFGLLGLLGFDCVEWANTRGNGAPHKQVPNEFSFFLGCGFGDWTRDNCSQANFRSNMNTSRLVLFEKISRRAFPLASRLGAAKTRCMSSSSSRSSAAHSTQSLQTMIIIAFEFAESSSWCLTSPHSLHRRSPLAFIGLDDGCPIAPSSGQVELPPPSVRRSTLPIPHWHGMATHSPFLHRRLLS